MTSHPNQSLDDLRNTIKSIDKDIISLIKQRVDVAKQIGDIKTAQNKPIKNYHVEKQVLDRIRGLADNQDLLQSTADNLTHILIQEAVRGQENERRTTQATQDGDHYLIIGGEGRMGRWFQTYLKQGGAQVTTVDKDSNPDYTAIPRLDPYDAVLITTPIQPMPTILNKLHKRKPDAMIADIASTKQPINHILKDMKADEIPVTSIHPMFDSDVKTLNGRNIIIASLGVDEADQRVKALFENTAATITTMPIDDHDDTITTTLVLPHIISLAFGSLLHQTQHDQDDFNSIAGTTFLKQLEATKEVFEENPTVYHAIQHHTDHDVFNELIDVLAQIKQVGQQENPVHLETMMNEIEPSLTSSDKKKS